MRLLVAFCIGVVVTFGWQSYSGAVREMIADLSPQLSWLAPQTAVADTDPAPAIAALDQQELKTMSDDLATLRQKVDQLAASQEQMARDFTMELHAVEQDILNKISAPPPQPVGAPVRKPSQSPVQAAPLR